MESLPDDHFVKSQQFTKQTFRNLYPSIDPRSTALSQTGKVVIIIGGGRGLGARAFAPAFAKAGVKAIVLVARNLENLKSVENTIKSISRETETLLVPTDILDAGSVDALFRKICDTYGHADVLINNAGGLTEGTLKDVDSKMWWSDFEINSHAAFLTTQKFLKCLPTTSDGTIINIVSAVAHGVIPGMSAYSLSKLVSLQMTAFIDAENENVNAFAVHPGIVETDMTTESFRPFAKDSPDLVGGLAVWLCTDKARFLSGRYIDANWSVAELMERKEEIESKNKLKMALKGEFGKEQFE